MTTATAINPTTERELFDNSFETWISEHSEEQVQKTY